MDTLKAMPKLSKPLTDSQVKNAKPKDKPYKLPDGERLYLLVNPDGGKYWRLDYTRPATKKSNTLSLGSYPEISLSEARARRQAARSNLAHGLDPSDVKKTEARKVKMEAENTFKAVAMEWFEKQKYSASTIERTHYIFELPFRKLGNRPIKDILPIDVLDVLRIPESEGKLEKAKKMRIKFGQVFRYAVSLGLIPSDPTRDLKGALANPETTHFSAITDSLELAKLILDIDNYKGRHLTIYALKLAPLLFVRPGELRAMRWKDLDLSAKQWRYTPNKTRKSTKVEMIIPLPNQAVEILKEVQEVSGRYDYVFTAIHTNQGCMSENTVNQALRRMGWGKEDVCGHGFRATARTILEEELKYPPEVIEMQLAHQVKDSNGRAYNRTWKLDERKEMMQRWADHLDVLRLVG